MDHEQLGRFNRAVFLLTRGRRDQGAKGQPGVIMLKKLPKLSIPDFNLTAVLTGVGVLVTGLILGWAMRGVLLSPANVATSASYEDWRTECAARSEEQGACEMFEVIVDNKTGQPLARLAFAQRDGDLILAVTLPYEVLLEPGVGLSLNGGPVEVYQFRTCNTLGCIMTVPVTDELQANLEKSDNGRLIYAGLDAQTKGIDFPMHGFGDALAALKWGDAKRGSLWWRLWL